MLRRNAEVGFFDDEDTQKVIRRIAAANKLTIFTGAGVAADLNIPNWPNLVAQLLEGREFPVHTDEENRRASVQFAIDFHHQLPTASIVDEMYRDAFPDDHLEQRNADIAKLLYPHGDQAQVPDDALAVYVLRLAAAKRLADCDVHIATTNYDDSLEFIARTEQDGLSDLSTDGVRVFTNWNAEEGPVPGIPVFHVHGLIPRDGAARDVVFSEREYIAWDQSSTWRDYLFKRVAGGVTLFIGYSLRDYNIASMIKRAGNGEVYALFPVEDEVRRAAERGMTWHHAIADYATLRGRHLGVRVLRPDFFGQVCQFLNEAAIPPEMAIPEYSTRLNDWARRWSSGAPEKDEPVERCRRLRRFSAEELDRLPRASHAKAEIWVRQDPDARELLLHATSQTVILPEEGYWAHCAKISHSSRYAAVYAFAARRAIEGKVDYRNDDRWTHFLAVPIILPEAPYYELPVGVMIFLLHAPGVANERYFGEAGREAMRGLSVRMKELGQEFLRPAGSA